MSSITLENFVLQCACGEMFACLSPGEKDIFECLRVARALGWARIQRKNVLIQISRAEHVAIRVKASCGKCIADGGSKAA